MCIGGDVRTGRADRACGRAQVSSLATNGNTWVSSGGEAIMVAPEQLREAMEEELWAPGLDDLTLHETLADLQDKIRAGGYEGVDETGPGPGPEDLLDAHKDVDGHDDYSKPLRHRYSSKRPPDAEGDTRPRIGEEEFKRRRQVFQPSLEDVPEAEHGDGLDEEFAVASLDLAAEEAAQHGAFYVTQDTFGIFDQAMDFLNRAFIARKPVTARGAKKAMEKEIPFTCIPMEQRNSYRAALSKQWGEFLKWEAVEVLTLEQSREVARTAPAEAVMNCRVLYRDKNVSFRAPDNPLPLLAKARIIIPGHRDPELHLGVRRTRLR